MSDLDIQIQEFIEALREFVRAERALMQLDISLAINRHFELLEPTFRLDSVVKACTENNIAIPQVVYSKN